MTDDLNYDDWARWIYDTCRLFGVAPGDAATVAGMFIAAVRGERRPRAQGIGGAP